MLSESSGATMADRKEIVKVLASTTGTEDLVIDPVATSTAFDSARQSNKCMGSLFRRSRIHLTLNDAR